MIKSPYKNEGQIWIASRLKDFGFFPEFSGNSGNYMKGLTSHLGARKREVFLDKIDLILETQNPLAEMQIASLAGNDQKLLKMVYSTGIMSSVVMLDRIMDIIDDMNLEPNNIIDFGGANGWSLKLLKEFIESDVELTLIEQNPNWGNVDSEINCQFESYENVSLSNKADLGISIFGAPHVIFNQLTECINRNLNESAVFITGLRIGDNQTLQQFLNLMNKNSFFLNMNFSERIQIGFEKFPIMVFERSNDLHLKNISLSDFKITS